MADSTLVIKDVRPPAIYVIRHGHTKFNNDGRTSVDRIRGWIDVPLDDVGEQDAELIGQMLAGVSVDAIVTSDLKRSAETAEIAAKYMGVPVSVKTPAFRPWNLGDFQGQPSVDSIAEIKDYINNRPDEKVPGGESFNEFKLRFLKGLESVGDTIDKGRLKRVAVFTHFRGLKMADSWAKAGGEGTEIDTEQFTRNDASPGSVLEMTPRKGGGWEGKMLFKGFSATDPKPVKLESP